MTARLILSDGKIFPGKIFAKGPDCSGEIIFNTAMSGYQEVLTDPSYKSQIVVMTYPLIGNYGINEHDSQSSDIHVEGFVVKEYIDFASNWESTQTLKEYLEAHNKIGIEGIDTRRLTRHIRDHGAQRALITESDESDASLLAKLRESPLISGENTVALVSTKNRYEWSTPETPLFRVAVIDCGVKFGILDHLTRIGAQVSVFPYTVTSQTLLDEGFDGIMVSNGPGDPEPVREVIDTIKSLAGKVPIMGICLGHQLITLAFDMAIKKLQFGHHGLNHPVKNMLTEKVEITSQNHIYCTDDSVLHPDFEITHINLNDQSIAGIRSEKLHVFSVQHHPETSPGPFDSHYLFEEFAYLMTHKAFEISSKKKVVDHA
jgi:carbamoyl-phosphate synthase small subunit